MAENRSPYATWLYDKAKLSFMFGLVSQLSWTSILKEYCGIQYGYGLIDIQLMIYATNVVQFLEYFQSYPTCTNVQ